MATILEQIVADKYVEVNLMKQAKPLNNFKQDVLVSPRDFYAALSAANPAFILECKPKSPSKGIINPDFNLPKILKAYQPFATCISVLTDHKYFGGSYENLTLAEQMVDQPLLCKDFIIDAYQIYYARLKGAHAVLLMLSVLSDAQYLALREVAHSLKMGVLTETSNEAEVKRAIALDARVIGINNRDLHTLTVDLNTTRRLAALIPEDRIVISESGIASHQDVVDLSSVADGFLVGSHLMGAANLESAVRALIVGTHKVCGLTTLEAAQAAFDAGAYYGGLIFVEKSPRFITPAKAKALQVVPLQYVGVFQNEALERVVTISNALNLKAVQLHGDESLDYIDALREKLPKTTEIFKALDATNMAEYQSYLTHRAIDCIVLDYQSGGTGKSFDWSILDDLPAHRYLLAGGVGAHNVRDALTHPIMGVDMNSALEMNKGEKSPEKIHTVFHMIRTSIKN
ncbi:bifunctional indole-3-glycerol-phosphate synthase TrpC/phosphoribosylanthranilate isomerase TrpF [Wohlfahrtiimonas chitiniclastica]|uniref:bifunctional indole-3-glycerol-phosphate synthase TrpC/phosphoribosylanthranilate isomerase TrpF n=1 Tax=Wohlfahrtiimonas chitiniclastica TaxID=400946 RepID=UPI001BCE7ABA|nr:bifunctional indole-3-glycerol-phosphate synthase TrpC/phosphoribosylanthranilate isomerase TrpF [Wohlfahrtiimonas chitiniclastica]MBS7834663.1 bifunctional indole-3-glycerol-phosphate synthase TrpC/phosphoribosylanthranilate isomerase TrpF [Wohlfahrtiimonas chitiniclastica]